MGKDEDLFRVVFENNAIPIALLKLDTTIVMVNDAYCTFSGYAQEELIGLKWRPQLLLDQIERPNEYTDKHPGEFEEVLSENEMFFYTKRGVGKYANIFTKHIKELNLIIATFFDTTERKATEIKIESQKEELKQQVAKIDKESAWQAIQLVKHNEFTSRLMLKLHKLRQQVKNENISFITDINKLIEEVIQQQQILALARNNDIFLPKQPQFIPDLLNRHPDLTPAEIKLCTLLHLNIGTKEIVSITSQTYDSVRVARTRLRKKLKLQNNNSLVAYLMQF